MQKIKVGDKVKVMRGKDAGLTGEVLKVVKNNDTNQVKGVIVSKANIAIINRKPQPLLGIPGERVEVEKPIAISNVMLLEGDTPTRVRIEDGKRISVKSGKEIK